MASKLSWNKGVGIRSSREQNSNQFLFRIRSYHFLYFSVGIKAYLDVITEFYRKKNYRSTQLATLATSTLYISWWLMTQVVSHRRTVWCFLVDKFHEYYAKLTYLSAILPPVAIKCMSSEEYAASRVSQRLPLRVYFAILGYRKASWTATEMVSDESNVLVEEHKCMPRPVQIKSSLPKFCLSKRSYQLTTGL